MRATTLVKHLLHIKLIYLLYIITIYYKNEEIGVNLLSHDLKHI